MGTGGQCVMTDGQPLVLMLHAGPVHAWRSAMGPAGRTSSSAGIPSVQSNTLGISVTVQKWLHIVASPRTHTNITFTIFSHQMIDHPLHMQYSGNET